MYHLLFNIVLTNRDEVVQQHFKSELSYNEILSVVSAQHNVSLTICQLKRIFKNGFIAKDAKKFNQQCSCVSYRWIRVFFQMLRIQSKAPKIADERFHHWSLIMRVCIWFWKNFILMVLNKKRVIIWLDGPMFYWPQPHLAHRWVWQIKTIWICYPWYNRWW